MTADVRAWSQPAVRQVVAWALPELRRRRTEEAERRHGNGGWPADDEADEVAAWIADAVREFRRQALARQVTLPAGVEADERLWSAARLALHAELLGLGRLQPLLADPTIQDIHINGHDVVWVVRDDGTKEQIGPIADSDEDLIELFRQIGARRGSTERPWDPAHPVLEQELRVPGLPPGFRVTAVMGITERPSVHIRRPPTTGRLARLEDLVAVGSLSEDTARLLAAAVRARCNIVVAGDKGAGKTTLLRALIHEIPPHERILTIEDSRELAIGTVTDRDGRALHPDTVSFEVRAANSERAGQFTLQDCLRTSLHFNPDRLIVGEVRDVEADDMVDAMLGSAAGSMCTVHAGSARKAIARLHMLMCKHGALDEASARRMLVDAIDLVVFQAHELDSRRRYAAEIVSVDGLEADGRIVQFTDVFSTDRPGRGSLPTGLRQRLAQAGYRHPTTGRPAMTVGGTP